MPVMNDGHPDAQLIDRLGGPVALATLCDVSSQAVSQWKRYGIPKARRQFLRLARPDVGWPESAAAPSARTQSGNEMQVRDAA